MYEQEEEDLDALRLAALKTLQKPGSFPPVQPPPIEPYLPVANPGSWNPAQYHPRMVYPHTVPYNPVMPGMVPTPTIAPIVPLLPPIASIPLVPPLTSNVQLSPRSAAFVSKNNDILARRKQAKSPGRWSRSPSPFGRKYRRSISRSPTPKIRRRSRSRSPKYNHRRRRSPGRSPPRNNYINGGNWRSANNSPVPRKRTRTPPPRSPPGGRRFNKHFRNNDRDRKRKTPEKSKPKEQEKEEKHHSKSKSLSPAASLERILANMDEEYKIDFCDDKAIEDDDLLAKIDSAEKEELHSSTLKNEQIQEAEMQTKQPDKTHKTEIDIEDELLASDDEVLNLSPDIDLFASEESESENEGRFKSGTIKTERKTTSVVPFSKLLAGSVAATDQRKNDGRREERGKRIETKRDEKQKTADSRPKVSSIVNVNNKDEIKPENKRDERRIIRRPVTAPKIEDKKDLSRKPIRLSGRLGDIVADRDKSSARTLTSTITRTKTKITWRSEKV